MKVSEFKRICKFRKDRTCKIVTLMLNRWWKHSFSSQTLKMYAKRRDKRELEIEAVFHANVDIALPLDQPPE